MALRRLAAAVAFTVLLGGTPPAAGRATEPHRRVPLPDAAVAELHAGLEAMRTLSVHQRRIAWAAVRRRSLAALAAMESAKPTAADADAILRRELARLGDNHSSLRSPTEAAAADRGQLAATFGITVL